MRFFPVGAAAVCLFVWEAVAAVVVHGAAEADEVSLSRRAGGGGWIPGPECCLACAYSAGCCCPPRPRPVTVNITVCRPPGRIVGRDDGELGEPDIAWDGPDDRAAEEERGWERRNCPDGYRQEHDPCGEEYVFKEDCDAWEEAGNDFQEVYKEVVDAYEEQFQYDSQPDSASHENGLNKVARSGKQDQIPHEDQLYEVSDANKLDKVS